MIATPVATRFILRFSLPESVAKSDKGSMEPLGSLKLCFYPVFTVSWMPRWNHKLNVYLSLLSLVTLIMIVVFLTMWCLGMSLVSFIKFMNTYRSH